jgi:hypothetical protein
MFPGITSKLSESVVASASTITAKTDFIRLTGVTTIDKIVPQFGGFSGLLFITPTDGDINFSTGGGGNISIGFSLTQNQLALLVYSKSRGLWYPNFL